MTKEKPKDLFDMGYLNDLPESMRKLLPKNTESVSSKILQLFELKKELTVAEIMIGLYRKYKIEISNNKLRMLLSYLDKGKGLIKRKKDAGSLLVYIKP